jgi:hypothetical protein
VTSPCFRAGRRPDGEYFSAVSRLVGWKSGTTTSSNATVVRFSASQARSDQEE